MLSPLTKCKGDYVDNLQHVTLLKKMYKSTYYTEPWYLEPSCFYV